MTSPVGDLDRPFVSAAVEALLDAGPAPLPSGTTNRVPPVLVARHTEDVRTR